MHQSIALVSIAHQFEKADIDFGQDKSGAIVYVDLS